MIIENGKFPKVTFYKITDSGPSPVESDKIFNKKTILVGVPGAFTPTCSEEHIPGYEKLKDEFFKKDIEKIYVVSTNDPFIMKSWSVSLGISEIDFISDGNGEFRGKSGLEIDLSSVGLGKRLSRFAMLIESGVVKKVFNEEGPGLDVSKAENVLKSI